MAITVKAHANDDDVLIAWRPDPWPTEWIGFALERRNLKTNETQTLGNRIPPTVNGSVVPPSGISSLQSPIRRCIWTDHAVDDADKVAYRVTPVKGDFVAVTDAASPWTAPLTLTADAGDGLSAYFNRGTLMSQVVSRFVGEKPNVAALKKFKTQLAVPGFPARRYLSGQARHELLGFLTDADRRGNSVFAALYECNDQELIDALKPFGKRGNVLLGNGATMKHDLGDELEGAGLTVHHRDLSKNGKSSPSVHNKFIVEVNPANNALRVLTGSTNWTTTGLCTQLNNVLVIERPPIAMRFRKQWDALVAAKDDMPAPLKQANAKWTTDGPVSVAFAATPGEAEFKPVLELIRDAKDGLLFLMFMPGQSPLLDALLGRSNEPNGPIVQGVVSTVTETATGKIIEHGAHVIRKGDSKKLNEVILPDGVGPQNLPPWEVEEFTRRMFLPAGLNAIVHSKVIIVDPFSDNCAVVTGSHNFSDSASTKNDENLVIVRGNKQLAQAYAVHIQGVYDHYSWRAFLSEGGDPTKLFSGLKDWRAKGPRARDLAFWLR